MAHIPLPTRPVLFALLLLIAPSLTAGEDTSPETEKAFTPSAMQKVIAEEVDLSRWETDTGIESVLALPSGAGNAAKDYSLLEEQFASDLADDGKTVRLDADGLAIIERATAKKGCDLVPAYLEPMVDRWTPAPNTLVFVGYMDALKRLSAELESGMQYDEARAALERILIMGWHFTEDRPSIVTMSLGLTLQANAVNALEAFYTRRIQLAKARQCRAYREFLRKLMNNIVYKSRKQLGQWRNFQCLYACMVTARKDADPAWRQEALLNLGVLQNGYPSADLAVWHTDPVQQNAARECLREVSRSDKQKSIRQLAAWCLKEMTLPNIRAWREKGNKTQ